LFDGQRRVGRQERRCKVHAPDPSRRARYDVKYLL
jgi:hypothetical protein